MRSSMSVQAIAGMVLASVAAPSSLQAASPVEITSTKNLDCTLKLTNDHVSDVIMMQHSTGSASACKTRCAEFAASSLMSMRDEVATLRYTCLYKDRAVERRNLKR